MEGGEPLDAPPGRPTGKVLPQEHAIKNKAHWAASERGLGQEWEGSE